eukprot:2205802-Rhodomonas_salina.3
MLLVHSILDPETPSQNLGSHSTYRRQVAVPGGRAQLCARSQPPLRSAHRLRIPHQTGMHHHLSAGQRAHVAVPRQTETKTYLFGPVDFKGPAVSVNVKPQPQLQTPN